jgi:hypothetical protein
MKRFAHFMNPGLRIFAGWKGTLAILLLCTTVASPNAQPQSNTNSKASATSSNASLNEAHVPQSVFVMPKDKHDGVDPFFPRSLRPFGPVMPIVVETNQPAPVTVAVELKLKAISGLPEHRLALINNHTFEAGEEGEVLTTNGRMRIRCLEIHGESAIVQVGPERRELHLRSNF